MRQKSAVPFLKSRIVPVDALDGLPDAMREIYLGKLDLLIVQGVFSPETMGRIRQRLETNEAGLEITPQEERVVNHDRQLIYGRSITPNAFQKGPPIDAYLQAAERFRRGCRRLFEGEPDFETRITETFRRMAGGRDVKVPTHHDGRTYTPATVRYVPTERHMPIHVGNYFLKMKCYEHLATIIDLTDQLSFFLPIATPDTGGGLVVYEMKFGDPDIPFMRDIPEAIDLDEVEKRYASERFTPGVGDLLLFNGGHFYHRVEHVGGPRARWTIGGFAAFAKHEPTVFFWA